MKATVYKKHDGEGQFPLFSKGAKVENVKSCQQYEFWSSCTIDGYDTYISNTYISDGILNRDYNPTELVLNKGDVVTILEVAFDWAYAEDEQGTKGWVPFGILYSN
ncbi:SH3 domain-containing protein [Breznakia pachnodae]|uniref:SH3 domain-containing protein n=1 Tax=Breznakia pachnodae TaxID=265178 RepID=A0ABU0E788_9FIRM|nr:SH3 domain-containing protein [Breznakia pachnodae]MDQ0362345.1 hypothetical protein [Breznakia pachnodae]